jgi:hypothetical protein
VLVVSSYPPIPLPAAAAAVAAVRRAWAEGDEVTVVSPRLSAAHLAVPVVGILAGRRLENLRRHTAATRLVVVMEPGVPVPTTGGRGLTARAEQWQTVRSLLRSFSGFDHVTLVRVGDLDVPGRIAAGLFAAADETIEFPADSPPEGPSDATASGPTLAVTATAAHVTAAHVTALGPTDVLPGERPRQLARLAFHRLLGPYAAPVRARLHTVLRR